MPPKTTSYIYRNPATAALHGNNTCKAARRADARENDALRFGSHDEAAGMTQHPERTTRGTTIHQKQALLSRVLRIKTDGSSNAQRKSKLSAKYISSSPPRTIAHPLRCHIEEELRCSTRPQLSQLMVGLLRKTTYPSYVPMYFPSALCLQPKKKKRDKKNAGARVSRKRDCRKCYVNLSGKTERSAWEGKGEGTIIRRSSFVLNSR